MNVKQLQKILAKMPQDANVILWSNEMGNYFSVTTAKLENISIIHGMHHDYPSRIIGVGVVLGSDE
jgi:hypothetical protein